ncbi:hypothetical protein C8R43DRAFT_959546 [Mycena crocata]|nr:hypothetical protein C8R43DRAFT_959546 [Mycena crocata]
MASGAQLNSSEFFLPGFDLLQQSFGVRRRKVARHLRRRKASCSRWECCEFESSAAQSCQGGLGNFLKHQGLLVETAAEMRKYRPKLANVPHYPTTYWSGAGLDLMALDGSSRDNPWILDENGKLVLPNSNSTPRTVIPRQPRFVFPGLRVKFGDSVICQRVRFILGIRDVCSHIAAVPKVPANPGIDPLFAVDRDHERRYRRRVGFPSPPTTTQTSATTTTSTHTSTGASTSASSTSTSTSRTSISTRSDLPTRPMRKTLKRAKPYDINRTPPRGWEFRPPILQAPSAGATRVRKRFPGRREERDKPLTSDDLYLTDARPPILRGVKPYHQCSLCYNVKSHPVSLETHWTCRICNAVIHRAPIQHDGEVKSIANDYPGWKDVSQVHINWDGLVFPERRRIICYSPSP